MDPAGVMSQIKKKKNYENDAMLILMTFTVLTTFYFL